MSRSSPGHIANVVGSLRSSYSGGTTTTVVVPKLGQPVLRVGRGAYWFEAPDQARTDLSTRAPLRRLMAFLVERRLAEHRAGKGAKYLRGRGPLELAYSRPIGDRAAASREEARIKRLSKTTKEALIAG